MGQKPTHCLKWRRLVCCWSLLSSPGLQVGFLLCCQIPTEHLQTGPLKTAQLLLDLHTGGSGCAARGRRSEHCSIYCLTALNYYNLYENIVEKLERGKTYLDVDKYVQRIMKTRFFLPVQELWFCTDMFLYYKNSTLFWYRIFWHYKLHSHIKTFSSTIHA